MPTDPAAAAARTLSLADRRLAWWAYLGGLAAILVSLTASGLLTWQHLSGRPLPGCGTGAPSLTGAIAEATKVSACASLEAHPMGSLGGMRAWLEGRREGKTVEKISPEQAAWPVSLLGFAYFSAALAAWLVVGGQGRRVGAWARGVVWLGVMASFAYIAVIVVARKFCPYCIASHAGNLALATFMEIGMLMTSTGPVRPAAAGRPGFKGLGAVLAGLAVFAGTTAALGVKEGERREEIVSASNRELEITMKVLAEQTAAAAARAAEPAPEKLPWGEKGFTGRWLLGPAEAQARVVMIMSYQCPDCKIFEERFMELFEKNKGKVSLSVFHYPMCPDCNKYIQGGNLHPNGCVAAGVAEAAAVVAGSRAALEGGDQYAASNDAFWKMHVWLFGRKGSFTTDELKAALPGLGFADVEQFLKVMNGPGVKKTVEADIEVAEALGLYYTPMMFVNGVEVRGWLTNALALNQAVEAVLAANPPAAGPRNDRPDLAHEKCIQDWARAQPRPLQIRDGRTKGAADAKVHVVVMGDYTEPNTKKVDEMVRGWVGSKSVKYSFMHYPGAKECNPNLPRDFFVNGCLGARAAEAAGIVGGPEGFWNMHEFLFQNGVSAQRITLGAGMMSLDEKKFADALAGAAAKQNVAADVTALTAVGLRTIPTVYVDGKLVERWDYKGFPVLEKIVERALGGGAATGGAKPPDKK